MISRAQFEQILSGSQESEVNLVFLGMSGSGKSHWSKKLEKERGMRRIEFDARIGTSVELEDLLMDFSGKDVAEKMGNYFGMPWDAKFEEKERQYLAIEKKMMRNYSGRGEVLDLTGSAIYHPEELQNIARTGLVIYLQPNEEAKKILFESYKSDPKPVCWNGVFQPKEGESSQEALERCFWNLLDYRIGQYEKHADITIAFPVHRGAKTLEELEEAICKQLIMDN